MLIFGKSKPCFMERSGLFFTQTPKVFSSSARFASANPFSAVKCPEKELSKDIAQMCGGEVVSIPKEVIPAVVADHVLGGGFYNSSLSKTERENLVGATNTSSGSYKFSNLDGLKLLDNYSLLSKELRLALSGGHRLYAHNRRESLGTKVREKYIGENFNNDSQAYKESKIIVSFNDERSDCVQLCHQKNGDVIVSYKGQSFILDIKCPTGDNLSHASGLMTCLIGRSVDYSIFLQKYTDCFTYIEKSGEFTLKYKNKAADLHSYSKFLKLSEYSEERKIFEMSFEVIKFNMENSNPNGYNIPVLMADPANTIYGQSSLRHLLKTPELADIDTQANNVVEEVVSNTNDPSNIRTIFNTHINFCSGGIKKTTLVDIALEICNNSIKKPRNILPDAYGVD